MKSLGAKPFIYPQPVLIVSSYDEEGKADAMNVAYGGIVNSDRLQINIGVRHKTSANIKLKQAFTVGIADVANIIPADYVGIASGNDTPDKMKKTGWTMLKSENVDAPYVEELPITMECTVEEINQYDQTLRIVAKIVNTMVREDLLDENGVVDISKLKAISYDPSGHAYVTLTEKVGQAFSDGNQLK